MVPCLNCERIKMYTPDPDDGYSTTTPKEGWWKVTTESSVVQKISIDEVCTKVRTVAIKKFSKAGHAPVRRKQIYVNFENGPKGVDVCHYCGFENETADGKTIRMGWDCGRCGSN